MNYKKILVTGGAGFVGSNICVKLREYYSGISVTVLDNLYRKGSEYNLPRLAKSGVRFIRGDVRNKKDLEIPAIDLIIECSAEPSVLAGVNSSPEYLLETNLGGAVNCFELARRNRADVIFISTSRVYPADKINELKYRETPSRFEINKNQKYPGVSHDGISENFPLEGIRSLYGASKLSAELVLSEYIDTYGIRGVIDRCGVITGPWQFGKSDQGIISYWLTSHYLRRKLKYIGYRGKGKQVRDILHIDDLFDLVIIQINHISKFSGRVYNVGGGRERSISLLELTEKCRRLTGYKMAPGSEPETRKNDIKYYVSDNRKVMKAAEWKPKKSTDEILTDTFEWISSNSQKLQPQFDSL